MVAKGLLEKNEMGRGGGWEEFREPNDHDPSLGLISYNIKQLSHPRVYVKAKRR